MEFEHSPNGDPSFSVVAQDMGGQDITLGSSDTPLPVLASTAQKDKSRKELDDRFQCSLMAGSYMEAHDTGDHAGSDPDKDFQFLDFLKQNVSHSHTQSDDEISIGMYDFNAMPDPGSLIHVDSNISLGSWLGDVASEKPQVATLKSNESSLCGKRPETEKSVSEYSRIASRYLLSESQLNNTEQDSASSGMQSSVSSLDVVPSDPLYEHAKNSLAAAAEPVEDKIAGATCGEENLDEENGVLNFSGIEFQNKLDLQHEFFGSEEFTGDAAEIVDKDEEIFEEENKLLIHSGEEVGDVTGMGFSALPDSPFSDFPEAKMSIGAYMAARSGKMGRLDEEQVSVNRPSFGMKIRTPSPRKPFPLLRPQSVQETFDADASAQDVKCPLPEEAALPEPKPALDDTLTGEDPEARQEMSLPHDTADENDNETSQDVTIEPSMLSLSEAIMNMSTSVNNEELARAIIEISKKKKQERVARQGKMKDASQKKKPDNRLSRKSPARKSETQPEYGTSRATQAPQPPTEPKQTKRVSHIPLSSRPTSPPKPVRMSYAKRQSATKVTSDEQAETDSVASTAVPKPVETDHPPRLQQRTNKPTPVCADSDQPLDRISIGRTKKPRNMTRENQDQEKPVPLRSVENTADYNNRHRSKSFSETKTAEKILPPLETTYPFKAGMEEVQNPVPRLTDSKRQPTLTSKVNFATQQHAEFEKQKPLKDIMQESFMQDTPEQDVVVEKSASEQEELPTFNNGRDSVCFPDETSSKYLLSSTRTDLSLTRGSLSRESIEQLHKKLRVRGTRCSNKGELPDLISPPVMQEVDEAVKMSKATDKAMDRRNETETLDDTIGAVKAENKDSRDSLQPLSQSSPEGKSSRYSGEFQHMLPSMSFAEMATIQEHEFDLRDLENEECKTLNKPGKLEVIQEEAETTHDTTISSQSTASGDSQLPSEISQDQNLIHQSQHSMPPHVPMMHPSQHMYPPMPHVMYRHPSSMSSASLPGPYPPDMHYRPMEGPYQVPPEYMGRGPHNMYPHHYGYPMSSSFAHHPMLHSTAPAGYPLEQPSMASGAEMGLNHTTNTMYQHGSYHHPSLGPRSATIDGRFHSFPETFFHQQHRRVEAAISVPTELVFPGVRCTSLLSHAKLPLVNKTDRWLQVELNIVSPAIDCCFSLESKPLVGPHDTKNVEVSFSPKKAGQFDALLEVISYPVTSEGAMLQNARSAPSMVVIKAMAQDAKAELRGPDDMMELNFGETLCDSAKCLPLRLLNKGSAEAPVCVVLCTKSQDRQCFAISESSNLEWSELDKRSQAILRTVLPLGDRVTTVWVHCRIPPRYCDAAEPPKCISAQVYMEIDNSQKQSLDTVVLDSISIEVVACVAKLHAPKNMQPMNFSCPRESAQTLAIPVKNCGNVSSRVTFSLLDGAEVFSVNPVHALLAAGDHVQVSVRFQPVRSTPNRLNPTLLMKIEPNGTKYEVMINAVCTEPESTRRSMSSESRGTIPGDMPSLLTNKSHVCWGGVPVGRSLQQRVVLRTSSGARKPLPMRVMIKGEDASFFQILCEDDNDGEELSSRQEITMRAGQDKIVRILFGPTKSRMALAKLEIKAPVDQVPSTKFTIPLSGYGGRSEVKVVELEPISQDDPGVELFAAYVDDTDKLTNEKNRGRVQIKFTVKNDSSRDAFVKAVFFSDKECLIPVFESGTSCAPSQFVLPKKTARALTLTLEVPPMTERSGHSRNGRDIIACVCLWHGDEIARHLLKCALSKLGPSAIRKSLSESNPLRNMSFDGIFESESSQGPEEDLSPIKPQLGDVQVFYTSIRKTVVQVFGPRSHKPLLEMVEAGRKNAAQPNGKQRSAAGNIVQSHQHYKRTNQGDEDDDSWGLSPDHVILAAPRHNATNEPSKIKLVNRSGEPLRFDIAWSGHYLTITPYNGHVDPESMLIILLNANPSLASRRDLLPWLGTVQVSALDGRGTKQLRVQIRDDVGPLDASVQPATPVPRLPLKAQYHEISSADSFATPFVSSGPSRVSSAEKNEDSSKIFISATTVDFGQAVVKSSAKSHFEFTNICPTSIRWLLTSFAPAYVKGLEPSGDLYRSTYAAFVFSHTSGLLESGAKVKIPVTFNPMSEGSYSQYWDLEHHEAADSAAMSLNKIRVQLVGKGVKPARSVIQPGNPMNASKPKAKDSAGIYVSEDTVHFPDVTIHESAMLKIPVKNSSKDSYSVRFLNVRPPFHITHQRHTIRPMSYACLPVTFKPIAKGEFEGTLVIQAGATHSLTVTLLGRGT